MMLDWVTGRVSSADLGIETFLALRDRVDRLQRFNPQTGNVVWETSAWDSVRSDSHQVAFKLGSDDLWLQGSPARCEGDGCNVFGGPVCQSLDHVAALQLMINMVSDEWMLPLPDAKLWKITRVDVTENYHLGALSNVRIALGVLRGVEGGRYRVSAKAGDTVYWNSKSTVASGKAYAKGPELENQVRKGKHDYSPQQLQAAGGLLRLELRLARHFFRDNPVVTPDLLRARHTAYFSRMVGAEMPKTEYSVRGLLLDLVNDSDSGVTEGQAKAVFATWCMLQSQGWEWCKEHLPPRTYYRHTKILRMIGLADADISAGKVVSLRRESLSLTPCLSWHSIAA